MEVFPPLHQIPQGILLGQVGHRAKSGSQLGLGTHISHDIVIDFSPLIFPPDPHPFLLSLLL